MTDNTTMIIGALAVIAILLSGFSLMKAPAAPTADDGGPKTQYLTIRMGEGKVLGEGHDTGEEVFVGEFHRWEPSSLVVHKGDTVVLKVTNPRSNVHSLVIPDFGVNTGRLEGRGGEATVTFVADKAGTFPFSCGVPHDEEAGDCAIDHNSQVGFISVLN